jgi:Autophagy protein ATG9
VYGFVFYDCSQFAFVVFFATYLTSCVEYTVLFTHLAGNGSEKLAIDDAVLPFNECITGFVISVILFAIYEKLNRQQV